MKYKVDIKDTSYATVEVDARSQEEAEQKAAELYYNGRVEWADCEVDYSARPAERERRNVR